MTPHKADQLTVVLMLLGL